MPSQPRSECTSTLTIQVTLAWFNSAINGLDSWTMKLNGPDSANDQTRLGETISQQLSLFTIKHQAFVWQDPNKCSERGQSIKSALFSQNDWPMDSSLLPSPSTFQSTLSLLIELIAHQCRLLLYLNFWNCSYISIMYMQAFYYAVRVIDWHFICCD